jgi:hypothetical protein
VNQNGTMVLAGATTGIKDVPDIASSGGGTTGGTSLTTNLTNTDHKHRVADIGGDEEFAKAGWWTGVVVWSFSGTQGVGHSHTINSHTHSTPNHTHPVVPTAVTHPTWLSFNGIEYVL